MELLSPDFTAHFTGLPTMDVEAYDHFEASVRSAFPDLRHRLEDVVVEAGTVAVRLTLESTHRGEFMGVPASGETISVEGTAFLKVADGRVTTMWGFLDQMGRLRQIGGLPAPVQAG